MFCSKCNSKWESQSNTNKCPFCGADLPKSKEIESISDAIEKIVSERGIDILHKPKLVYSLVTDYTAGHHKEKKLLSILAASDVFEKIFDLCSMSEEQEKSLQVQKIVSFLENDVFLSKDNAELILDIIFKGLNIKYTFVKEKVVQPVEDRQPQHSNKPINSSTQITNETPDALFQRGKKLYNGEGVPVDRNEAFRLFTQAAMQGHVDAQCYLGFCYDNGHGVAKNAAEAAKWYRLSAEKGNSDAQNLLGLCYKNGSGVEMNLAESLKWIQMSAMQGNVNGQYHLGLAYYFGRGVAINYTEAAKWIKLSAEQGSAEAQNNLGVMYKNGKGVPFNMAEALKWYQKAAAQGHIGAKYNLGVCYENGRGVAPNTQEAIRYYEQAAEYGHQLAKESLERIKKNSISKIIKTDTERVRIHLKYSSSPFSPADGLTYVVKIGDKTAIKLVSGKTDSFENAEVPIGEHTISVAIYGYGDPNCLKTPTWTSKEQRITVEKGRSYIIEITPSKFMGSPKIAIITE